MATLVFPLARIIIGLGVITIVACLAVTRKTGNAQVFLAIAPALEKSARGSASGRSDGGA